MTGTISTRPAGADDLDRIMDLVAAVSWPHRRDDVAHAMAETPAVCEQLHLPLQSGSDRVLALMHRGYTAERYLEINGIWEDHVRYAITAEEWDTRGEELIAEWIGY